MPSLDPTLQALHDKFGPAIEAVTVFRGETAVSVQRQALLDVLRCLKQEHGFSFLATLTAYDDWPAEPRFTVVYQLREMATPLNLRVKCAVPGDDAVLPSCTGLHLNAGWHEREVYDMFGVTFTGHPDLRRLLMPGDWQGHPLRKDYPLGYEEVQFSFNFDEIDRKKPYAKGE